MKEDIPNINVKKGDEVISYDGQGYPITESNKKYPESNFAMQKMLKSYAQNLLNAKGKNYFDKYSSHDKSIYDTPVHTNSSIVDDGYIVLILNVGVNVESHIVFE